MEYKKNRISKAKKQLIFDIDTNVAKKILGDGYRRIYTQIRVFLKEKNFTHIEGSAYMSNEPMSNVEIIEIIDELIETYPYLDKCVKNIHQADISKEHSLHMLFSYDGTIGDFELHPDIANPKSEPTKRRGR